MANPRVYKTKWFQRFARKENIADKALTDAVARIEAGQIDADLGDGVIKQRIARQGQGKSGGYRTIILYRQGELAVFQYGFAKSDRANLNRLEEIQFKNAARQVLALSESQVAHLVRRGYFVEVKGE